MKKYLIITVISAVLISGLAYSIVYVPQVNGFFRNLLVKKTDTSQTNQSQGEGTMPVVLIDTLPNLTINSSDNFKTVKFGDLNLKVNNEYKLSEAPERITMSIGDTEEIRGFYYPLDSSPRKDINPSEYESELIKNTYSLSKKSNIPESFVKEVFNLSIGSQVQDKIEGETVTYTVSDIITFKNPNLAGFYFGSDKTSKFKVIVISTNKLYIFNIKVSPDNFLKNQKTFYNMEIVN